MDVGGVREADIQRMTEGGLERARDAHITDGDGVACIYTGTTVRGQEWRPSAADPKTLEQVPGAPMPHGVGVATYTPPKATAFGENFLIASYDGPWENGKFHGKAKVTFANGQWSEATFEQGRLIQGGNLHFRLEKPERLVDDSGSQCTYQGGVVLMADQSRVFNGKGKSVYDPPKQDLRFGDRRIVECEGEWEAGVFVGVGV